HELSLETSEREVQWLNKLFADEASGSVGTPDFHPAEPTSVTRDEASKNSAAQQSAVPLQQEGDPDHG
ncbi:MAG: PadR family transcriptional regulator, partial [Gordonia sp. (in: high G+C Gram-positive bacteria)]